jgi:hypothetical protein
MIGGRTLDRIIGAGLAEEEDAATDCDAGH